MSYRLGSSQVRVVVILLLFACGPLSAQEIPDDWTELSVTPQQIRDPLFTHRMFPDDSRRRPGNAALIVLYTLSGKNETAWQRLVENAPRHLQVSRDEFSSERAREEVPLWFLDELRIAAYCDDADWGHPLEPGVALDRQRVSYAVDIKHILRGVAVHCRADIVDGDVNGALDKISIAFGIVAHLDKLSWPILRVFEAEIVEIYLDLIEELIQSGSSPNLYWALTAVPDRMLDLRPLADWISRWQWLHIPEVERLDEERSDAAWRSLRLRLRLFIVPKVYGAGIPDPKDVREDFRKFVRRGRAELTGIQPRLREEISDDEIAVRYFIDRCSIRADEYVSALLLPPESGLPRFRQSIRELKQEDAAVADAIPGVDDVYVSVWALRRRVTALRVVEAVRDYAARHGQFPASLKDVDEVPVPDDPVTGGPFEYQIEDEKTAYISGPAMEACDGKAVKLRYRIRLR